MRIFIPIFIILFSSGSLKAWIYPEHRDIALLAIQNLSPEYRSALDKLWAEARTGYENRLTETVIDATQNANSNKLDFASLPAISGDHSCSAKEMLDVVLHSEWILDVSKIAMQLEQNLLSADSRDSRINSIRDADLRFQNVDPFYATRAGSNNVHFLLALPNVQTDAITYGYLCLKEETPLNAVSAYVLYHYSALIKAHRLSKEILTPEERSALTISALGDEAFALHFLEDVFAAGHVAGTWGDASQRKGTHDYFNEKGLKVNTWEGNNVVLTGDGWMREEDAERVALVVQMSIEQFLDASGGKVVFLDSINIEDAYTTDNFNVCTETVVPAHQINPGMIPLLTDILMKTPVPGLATGIGELPRFRAEIGTFIGFSPSVSGALFSGGFGVGQDTPGLVGSVEAAVRFGIGLDGVLNEASDGLAFIELGWRQDGSTTTGVVSEPGIEKFGALFATIPGRSAYNVRFRMPFYLIPGDLLIAAPFLMLFSPNALTNMGVTAVNGGLIPWQAGMETSFGRFQFILGREVSVYFFGRTKERDALLYYFVDENGEGQIYILSYRSTQIEFPIIEYRPFRSFATDQSSKLLLQLYGRVDIPHNVESLSPEGVPPPQLRTIWHLGLRLVFDWRHYF